MTPLRGFLRSVGPVLLLAACCVGTIVSTSFADDAPRWYRGNTHTHSLWSDGDEFPEMVADWYKTHGYDFLVISDHNRLLRGEKWKDVGQGDEQVPAEVVDKCRNRFGADWLVVRTAANQRQVRLKTFDEVRGKLADPKFLLIPGEEISAEFKRSPVHINALNLAEVIAPAKGQSMADTISANLAAVEQQSQRLKRTILAQVNHPNWDNYDVSPDDLAQVPAARLFEIYNASCIPWQYGDAAYPSVEKFWDLVNTIRIGKLNAAPPYAIASDDTHNYQKFAADMANPGRAWIMVRAKRLDPDSLLAAIARGDFYATTGVILRDVAYDAGQRTVTVQVQAEPGVHYAIEFIGTLKGVDPAGKEAPPIKNGNDRPHKQPGRTYSPEVGKVLARVEGSSATYRLTGNELYVRPVVRSNKPIPNPADGEKENQTAWCQPVGWQRN
jgi:predicted metal-dependent phosphoesterase TrpH